MLKHKVAVIASALMALLLASTALAANGQPLVMGVLSNTATALTRLSGSAAEGTLQVISTGTGSALDLRVKTGTGIVPAAPLKVNSSTKVADLNADRLDGLDSAQLQRRVTGTCGVGSAVAAVNANGTVACNRGPNAPDPYAGSYALFINGQFAVALASFDGCTREYLSYKVTNPDGTTGMTYVPYTYRDCKIGLGLPDNGLLPLWLTNSLSDGGQKLRSVMIVRLPTATSPASALALTNAWISKFIMPALSRASTGSALFTLSLVFDSVAPTSVPSIPSGAGLVTPIAQSTLTGSVTRVNGDPMDSAGELSLTVAKVSAVDQNGDRVNRPGARSYSAFTGGIAPTKTTTLSDMMAWGTTDRGNRSAALRLSDARGVRGVDVTLVSVGISDGMDLLARTQDGNVHWHATPDGASYMFRHP